VQSQQDFLSELDEPWKRPGDDSGRRHGWTRESGDRGDRPEVQHAADAMVTKVKVESGK
jgi:hypothetical protein